jgi:hypothetical protein
MYRSTLSSPHQLLEVSVASSFLSLYPIERASSSNWIRGLMTGNIIVKGFLKSLQELLVRIAGGTVSSEPGPVIGCNEHGTEFSSSVISDLFNSRVNLCSS